MATSGEGAASYEGGGAGGKFRKRPFRRPQTPYDRPPASIRNPNAKGWLSKLVDPASKLIMTSAQMFFSSVFRKRLPLPPKIQHHKPESDQEPRDRLQEAVPNNYSGACNTSIDQVGNSSKSSDGNPILDLEQLLKQKTFTRSESDSLMALLRSRTVELPVGIADRTEKNNLSLSASDLENKDINRSQGILSPPIIGSGGNHENVTSPADLAKVYMGKVSPSMLGSDNQGLREKSTLTNNQALALTSKSPTLLLQSSNSSGGIGVRDNGLSSKNNRGRSAIYSMARSPYFGVHSTAQKGSRFMNDGFSGTPPSSSRRVGENGGYSHSKRADLKRASSALDDEVGSSGAIRRVRQKPNLSSQGNFGNGVAFHENHVSSSPQKPLSPNEANHKTTKIVEENSDGVRYPTKSSATGTKILQHLEKLTPKQKSSESKLVFGGSEKSATKLTSNMLSGQALKSLEYVDSAKFMRDPQSSHTSEDLKKDTVEENGPKMLMDPRDMLASPVHVYTATKDASHNAKGADINDELLLVAQSPQKRRAFQMSALEDSVELDEDMSPDEPQLALPVEEEREKREKSVVEMKAVPTEASQVDKYPALPQLNIPIPSKELTDFENGGGAVASADEKNGFTFSTPAAPPVLSTSNNNSKSISVTDKYVPAKDSNDSLPVFSFNSNNVDKVPSFTFSPSPAVDQSSDPKPSSPFAPKPETLNRLENLSSGTTDAQPKVTASDTEVIKINNTKQKGGDTNGNIDIVNSAVSTSPSTSAMFSFTAMNKNSNPDNVSLSSTPSIFSSTFPALPSTSSNQTLNNIFAQPISSASTTITSTATTAAATTTTTTTVPSAPAPPIFNFGSSLSPPTPTSSIAETTDSKAKTENKETFGNGNSSPFTSGSSNLFGSTSSVTNPTANKKSQAPPLFGTNSGSLITTQPSSSSGITPFTSGNSLFGSSTSSSDTASVSSSVTFGSSWKQQPDKSPTFPNPFTSPNQSVGFSFGAPSSSATATNTVPLMVFGSSTGSSSGPAFSFGSSTTAAPTSTPSSLLPQAQSVFGTAPVFNASSANTDQMSMEDSMAEDPVQAPPAFGQQPVFSTPAGLMFGTTAPAPANPFQFGGQQNPSPSPFQASGSLEFNAGGSFSLGSGAGDKSSRRTVRVSKNRNRKKQNG